jgi:hypothetical protein
VTNEARSPYYALLAELRLRAAEATWSVRRPARSERAGAHEHAERSRRRSA